MIVTIIVPVFNSEKYLERCLRSIINQTYRQLEIILVDDGSTDASGKICDDFASFDNRIIVIHQKNSGVSAARNVALSKASGQYISFVDSDDYIDCRFIEMHLCVLLKSKCSISVCDQFKVRDDFLENGNIPLKPGLNDWKDCIGLINGGCCNKMFRCEIMKGILFPTDKNFCEDMHVLSRLLVRSGGIFFIDERLYYYYQNPFSAVHSKDFNIYVEFEQSFKDLSFYMEAGLGKKKMNSIFKRYFRRFCTIDDKFYPNFPSQRAGAGFALYSFAKTYYEYFNFFNKFCLSFPNFYWKTKTILKKLFFPILCIRRRFIKEVW